MLSALLGGALLVGPLLLLHTGSTHASLRRALAGHAPSGAAAPARHAGSLVEPSWALAGDAVTTLASAGATATTAPVAPTTVPPPTTTTTTATTVPAPVPTTTTTAPPAPAAVAAPPTAVSGSSATGIATWYAAAAPGRCASPQLRFGTVLTVTDRASGASITCVVDDREGDNPGRVVDLSPADFSRLADLSQGVLEVTITW